MHLAPLVGDPLDLLFSTDGGAHGAYRGSPLAWRLNQAAAAVVAGARPRRVIEIGGGTAATTRALRDVLPNSVRSGCRDAEHGHPELGAGCREGGLGVGDEPGNGHGRSFTVTAAQHTRYGPVRLGSVGPNKATIGFPRAAAISLQRTPSARSL